MGYVIVTRYHGPTNYRGSRVIGTGPAPHLPAYDAPAGSVPLTRATVSWDYGAAAYAAGDRDGARYMQTEARRLARVLAEG